MLQNHFWQRNEASTPKKCGLFVWTRQWYHFQSRTPICLSLLASPTANFRHLCQVVLHLSPPNWQELERVNQILEQYLRCSVSYHQDDWVNLVSLAELTYNNSLHALIDVTPFFANCGLHPRFNISLPTTFVNPSTEGRAHIIEELHHDLSFELSLAGERYKK